MGVAARYYEPLLRALWTSGLNAAAFDLRGHGHSSVRASRSIDFGYNEILTRDFPCAIQEAARIFPRCPIFILGHSLGGQLACLYAAATEERIAGLILVASGSVYYRSWAFPWSWLVLFFTGAARIIAEIVGYFPGRQFGFGGREARRVMRDWSAQARTGRYQTSSSVIDFDSLLTTATMPVLAITLCGDRLAPHGAVRHLCSKMVRAKTEHRCVKIVGGRRRAHFQWVGESGVIIPHVLRWLADVVPAFDVGQTS
jgi:predicted alpha/beta hydrolase